MDIFEFAKSKELAAQEFYRNLAQKVPDTGLSGIFTLLANEEEKHLEIIEKMQAETDIENATTTILSDAQELFDKMRQGSKKFTYDKSELELYKEAQKIEQNARDFYLEKAQQTDKESHRDIFTKLAEEENKHYFLLDNIIEFVSRPEQWLENAEFYHLEEY
ncbi:MAG: ferritin family protein [Sedimentisphaerales bacterium]|nr:ferritin family protein [Sedimentisphaerales bacterium]